MGTKLENAVNPLESIVNSSNFIFHTVYDWEGHENRGLKKNKHNTQQFKFQDSMDKLLEKHNFESIKKTMQMHEAIFKQQVHELHRVYNVQKMLMDEFKKKFEKSKPSQSPSVSRAYSCYYANQQQQGAQSTFGYNFYVQNPREDQSTREWSASSCGDTIKIPRGFDLERPAEEANSSGASAIDEDQAGSSSHLLLKTRKMSTDEDDNVDLTLSIGGSKGKKKMRSCQSLSSQQLSFSDRPHDGSRKPDDTYGSLKSDQGGECRDPTATMSSSSNSTFDQETKRPQWLFPRLSLNKT